MKTQRGMTLIEVMVAMLVLSIAMLGGISFFTGAYRIRYSYLEHANRLDHALRYVEKLKVQRRNYPTAGYFRNIGTDSGGFTVYFVNSSSADVGPRPYFYENYAEGEDGTIRIPIKSSVKFYDPTPNNYLGYYSGESVKGGTVVGYDSDTVNSFTRKAYVPANWDAWHNTASDVSWKPDIDIYLPPGEGIYLRSGTMNDGVMSYNLDGIQQRLHQMTHEIGIIDGDAHVLHADGKRYAKLNTQTVSGMTVDGYFHYTYNPSSDNNRKFVSSGTYDAFLQLTFDQLLQRAAAYPTAPDPVLFPYINKVNAIPNGTAWSPYQGRIIYPHYTETRKNAPYDPGMDGKVRYQKHTGYTIPLDTGALPEGGNAAALSDEWKPHSLRFYSSGNISVVWQNGWSRPSDNFFTNITAVEVSRIEVSAFPSDAVLPQEQTIPSSGYTAGEVIYPPDNIWAVAQVYRNIASGNDRVQEIWWWQPGSGQWPPRPESGGGLTEIRSPKLTDSPNYTRPNVFEINVGVDNDFLGENIRRLTKYRRSAYISLYSVPTEADAQLIVSKLKSEFGSNLNGAVNYMKSLATPANSYKIIYIPFLQLYANDENSTLCEKLKD